MPVFFTCSKPHDVSWTDDLDRAALTLHEAAAGNDDERLAEWVRVPCRARGWLKSHRGSSSPRRWRGLKKRIDADGAREPVCGALRRGLSARAFDVHLFLPFGC